MQRRWLERSLHFGNYSIGDVGVPIIVNFIDACVETVWLSAVQQSNTSSIDACDNWLSCIVNGNISFIDAFSSHEKCSKTKNRTPNRLYWTPLQSFKHFADHWTVSRSDYLSMRAAIDVNDYAMLVSDSVAQDFYAVFVPLQFDCWLAFAAVVFAVGKCLDEAKISSKDLLF